MKRSPTFLVVFIFSIFLAISSTSAATKNIEGSSCKQSGLQQLQDRDLYSCVKVNSKLIWQLTDDNTSTFAPFPINGPTWQQLADIRDAAGKVTAEQAAAAKAKLDAEIAAAKAAADAKAAKTAAEIPKVAGLVIGKLLWSDDFEGQEGSQASSTSWTPRRCGQAASNGGGTCHNNEQQYYLSLIHI